MKDLLQIPPIRTRLDETTGQPAGLNAATGRTAKEWYLFWSNSGDQINQNRQDIADLTGVVERLVEVGTHADRPGSEAMPEEGALYVESDRGNALYQNQGGAWHYVSGMMLGTFSPDQRPAGLGVNDTGFQFRATDGTNAQRTFYWSGSAWIETTVTQYGTHATRPATSALPPRALYVETDRGNAIYQNQASNWVYVAGVMSGTVSPDQRPTSLGTNDTGFRFDATDTGQQFRWSGSAWVELLPALPYLWVVATAALTLTTTLTTVPGMTLTLNTAGRYVLRGLVDYNVIGAGDVGVYLLAYFFINGVQNSTVTAVLNSRADLRAVIPVELPVVVTAGAVVTFRASKSGGTGTSVCQANSHMSAQWVSKT